jgi:hypothetical protein
MINGIGTALLILTFPNQGLDGAAPPAFSPNQVNPVNPVKKTA